MGYWCYLCPLLWVVCVLNCDLKCESDVYLTLHEMILIQYHSQHTLS